MFTPQMDFTEFFDRTAPRLVRMCFLVTLDREAAADAAQEALSRAWRDWDRVGTDHNDPAAWARTVALDLCRNRWRRLSRQGGLAARAYTVDGRADDLPDVDLQRALRALPVRQREAVVLHYWADLDIAGCAAAMGVSPGSVKQHLARARRRRGGRPHHPRRRRERGGPGDHDGPADRSGGPGRVRRCGRRGPAGRRGGRPAGRAARSTAVRLRRPPGVGLRSPADPAGRGPGPSWRPPSCGPSRRRR